MSLLTLNTFHFSAVYQLMVASEDFSLIKVIIFIAKSCGIGLDNIFLYPDSFFQKSGHY